MKFVLIHYGPTDRTQDFSKTIYWKNKHVHPPNTWHSFCAATGGTFFNLREKNSLRDLQNKKPDVALFTFSWPNSYFVSIYPKLAASLKSKGCVVLLSFHEHMGHLNEILNHHPDYLEKLQTVAKSFDAYINADLPEYNFFWKQATRKPVFQWRFCFPIEKMRPCLITQKSGILLGPRPLTDTGRNFALNLLFGLALADQLDTTLTIIDHDKIHGIKVNSKRIRLIPKSLDWYAYLLEISKHRIVLNIDHTFTFGRVPADSCFAGTLCFGGFSECQKLLFPNLGYGHVDLHVIEKKILSYYNDEKKYGLSLTLARKNFRTYLSYEAFRKILAGTVSACF